MNKKRIALFHNLPEGGGYRMMQHIAYRYVKKFDVDIYTISDLQPKPIDGCNQIFIPVKPWKGFFLRNLWIYFKLPKIHKKIASEIDQKKYKKILITHDYFTKSPYLLRYLRLKKIYLCQEPQREFYEPSSVHTLTTKEKIANFFRQPIKKIDFINATFSDVILCNSKYSKTILDKIYGKSCRVIFPGVDENFFKPIKLKKKNMILCVGGINPVKDQLFLVRSLSPILNKYKIVLVGIGKKEYIKKIFDIPHKKYNIKILKKVSDKKLRNLYNEALVTCISAYNEPFGLSSIESQSCGTPVVSVSEGGPKETIVDGLTGFLSQRKSSEYLNKVKEAISRHKELGENARKQVIKKWTWKKTLNKLDKYIK